MRLTITTAAALIGLATAFGSAGMAPAASLPDGTPVIEAGGRHFGGHRGGGRHFGGHRGSGRHFGGHRGGGRHFGGHRGGGHRFGHDGGHRSGHRGNRHNFGRHNFGHNRYGHNNGYGYYQPYFYGGIGYGTYRFLNTTGGF